MLKKLRRGSFTAEGAFIIPLVFLLFFLLILITFHVHNRMWYRCAAYEAAIAGNGMSEDGKDGMPEKAEMLGRMRIRDQVMPGNEPVLQVKNTSGGTEVSFAGGEENTYFGKISSFRAEAKVKRVRPEKTVRLGWVAGKILNGGRDQ